MRRSVLGNLRAQGTGRHSRDEIYELGKEDLTALSVILADKPFMLGDEPTSVDATVYAFVASLLVPPLTTPLLAHASTLPNVESYRQRMEQRFF